MGHSTLIIVAMKVTLVLCASLALCLGCPELNPVTCRDGDMFCPGLMDADGCEMPGTCMPTKGGPIGTDGVECPVNCPSEPCGKEEMTCPMMINGCAMPDFCIPMKGGPVGTDGAECPVMCPDAMHPCGDAEDVMACSAMDANGCQMPDICMSTKGPDGKDGTECTVMCPSAPCGKDMLTCSGIEDANGCPMPDECLPMKGGPVGTDGVDCPVTCPVPPCGKDMIPCPQMADNGCPMPDLCMPLDPGCPTPPTLI